MKKFLTVSLLSLCFSIAQLSPVVSASETQASQVVLNWSEFLKLWNDSHRTPPVANPPPVDFVLSRAEYTGSVRFNSSEIQALFEVNILNGQNWVRIPFLPESIGLKRVLLDGKPVAIASCNGFHTLVMKGLGHHVLTTAFSIPTPDPDGAPSFSFPISETSMTLITLVFPEPNLEVTIGSAQALSTTYQKGTTVKAILSPSRLIQVTWHKKMIGGKELPAKIFSQVRELATIDESVMRLSSNFFYSILHSGLRHVSFHVPAGVTIIGVNGEGVADWKTGQGKESDVLTVQFNRAMKASAQIQISAEVSVKDAGVSSVPIIETIGVEREEGFVAIEAQTSVEVAVQESAHLRQVDVKELPQELWSRATSPLLFGFRFNESHPTLALEVERHEDVPVLNSTVDSANAVTVLTKDGQWITRASFQVRNHLKQYLLVTLPKGAEVWSAFVSGSPVKPSKDKEGRVLIPLQKSNLNDSEASFPVEILYYMADRDLSFEGERSAMLPKIDLPISESLWSVYVPEDITVLHFGGNMEKERYAVMPLSPFSLMAKDKEMTYRHQSQAPGQAKGGDESLEKVAGLIRSGLTSSREVQQPFGETAINAQARLEIDSLSDRDDAPSIRENHVLPIAFRIPEVGRVYRFGKIMVTNQTPRLSLIYVQSTLLTITRNAFAVALLGLLFVQRKRLLSIFRWFAVKGQSFLKFPLASQS